MRNSRLRFSAQPVLVRFFAGLSTFLAFGADAARPRPSQPCSPRPMAAEITIGTYNVENFWDDDPDNTKSAYVDYSDRKSNWHSDRMYVAKAKRVAEAIAYAGNPDILALEEIESAGGDSRVLDLLMEELSPRGYTHAVLGKQNPANPVAVTTAVVSKHPIIANESLDLDFDSATALEATPRERSNPSARDPQVVTVDLSGVQVRVYASHWKSRVGNAADGDKARMMAARVIRADIDRARASDPNLDIVVMGDFNAEQHEASVRQGLGMTGRRGDLSQDPASSKLYNLWFELSPDSRCSYVYQGRRLCLDHMLVNGALFDGQGIDLMPESFQVVGHGGGAAGALVSNALVPKRWQTRKEDGLTRHLGEGYSDHLPLTAEFKVYRPDSACVRAGSKKD